MIGDIVGPCGPLDNWDCVDWVDFGGSKDWDFGRLCHLDHI